MLLHTHTHTDTDRQTGRHTPQKGSNKEEERTEEGRRWQTGAGEREGEGEEGVSRKAQTNPPESQLQVRVQEQLHIEAVCENYFCHTVAAATHAHRLISISVHL